MSEEIKETITFPLRYNEYGQDIWDDNDNLVMDIRGWGRIQKMSNPEQRQDSIGLWVVKCLNEFQSLQQESERQSNIIEALKMQACIWAGEAKTQKNTVNQIGSLLGGVPDWGPIVKKVTEKIEENAQLCNALRMYAEKNKELQSQLDKKMEEVR